jgi:MFS family permease
MLSLGGILLSILLAALEQTVVGTALPRVVADLGGFEHYSWVFSAYLFTSTAITPVAGKLSDLFGRKRLIAVGILGFLLGSALCGAATTMLQLVLYRGLQGLGAGVLTAAAFAAIGDLFPPAERGKYQGLVVGVFGLASLFGPTLGGYLTDTVGWRWVFWLNLPVGGVALAVLLATFPARTAPRRRQAIDYASACSRSPRCCSGCSPGSSGARPSRSCRLTCSGTASSRSASSWWSSPAWRCTA